MIGKKTIGLIILFIIWVSIGSALDYPDYPEGYYPFEQTPTKNPPKVRRPPYAQSNAVCPGILESTEVAAQSLQNLCGNLNEGFLPVNPMGQKIKGQSYPFELIKNFTLEFFSKTLPILKQDKTLPKVAKYMDPKTPYVFRRKRIQKRKHDAKLSNEIQKTFDHRMYKRSTSEGRNSSYSSALEKSDETLPSVSFRKSREFFLNSDDISDDTKRRVVEEHFALTRAREEGRSTGSFCENNWGILCLIYNAVTGRNRKPLKRASDRNEDLGGRNSLSDGSLRPLTPCPSAVEYVTPVFARNYQGVWRYVVQIPYEGYFTQTVEITQCLSSKCHYLSGSCLSSPRWISLLVAEIYYPDAIFPVSTQNIPNFRRPMSSNVRPPPTGKGEFSLRQGHSEEEVKEKAKHCDGEDSIGCFQIRLYYDWFLVSGSCKCWKQDFYAQFALRNGRET